MSLFPRLNPARSRQNPKRPKRPPGALRTLLRTRGGLFSAVLVLLLVLMALFAPWLAPQDPNDLISLNLADARLPPAWLEGGSARYLVGTDDQGRDLFSALLYGARISLTVAALAVALSWLIGVGVGLAAGYLGGWVDALLMRLCDVMLAFPAILVALMVNGIGRAVFPQAQGTALEMGVLVLAIALAGWVPYARAVRGATQVERQKAYVDAARLVGLSDRLILVRHVLPNVLGTVWVLATLQLGGAILTEATLSFLGIGVPPTSPSLGTLIRIGNDYLLSGAWWIALMPGALLAVLALAINLLGDAWRDAANPRLR